MLCLTVLLTVTGNNGAGILQLSRPTTLSVRNPAVAHEKLSSFIIEK